MEEDTINITRPQKDTTFTVPESVRLSTKQQNKVAEKPKYPSESIGLPSEGYFYNSNNVRTSTDAFMDGGKRTLNINQPMIIFCNEDDNFLKQIIEFRKGYEDKTMIIPIKFSDTEFYQYLQILEYNPEKNKTNRNNLVHLITISKYLFIKIGRAHV